MLLPPRWACLRPLAAAAPPPSPRHLKEHWPTWKWQNRGTEVFRGSTRTNFWHLQARAPWPHRSVCDLSEGSSGWVSKQSEPHETWRHQHIQSDANRNFLARLRWETNGVSALWFQHEHQSAAHRFDGSWICFVSVALLVSLGESISMSGGVNGISSAISVSLPTASSNSSFFSTSSERLESQPAAINPRSSLRPGLLKSAFRTFKVWNCRF